MTEIAQRIEALLLVIGEAVTFEELAQTTGCAPTDIPVYATEIAQALADHGVSVVTTDQTIQLVTSSAVSSWLAVAWPAPSDELTPAAAETLALVAYRGPITRIALDTIRGVDSRRMIRHLLARDLIRLVDAQATVAQYVVTEVFLRQAGVARVQDLPQFATFSSDDKITDLLLSSA